jgi:hypothetical protein
MPGPYSSRFHGVVLCSPIGGPAPAKLLCEWPTKVGMVHSDRGGGSIVYNENQVKLRYLLTVRMT